MTPLLDADAVVRRVRDLPALPDALGEVLAALRRKDLHIDRCAALIEHDQALCGRTLKLANSPFYGLSGRIGTVGDAIRMLGLSTVGTLMTAALLSTRFDARRCAGFDFHRFLRHTLGVSIAARELASASGHDPDEASVAGLLHDVGLLAMAAYFPVELSAAMALARSTDVPSVQVEKVLLGLDHAEIGAVVARHWCLPAAAVEAIERHHAGPARANTPLCDIVHLADVIVHALNLSHDPDEFVPPVSIDAWHRLRVNALPMAQIFADVERGAQALGDALGL